MFDDLFIALNLAATAANPALLPDVISVRESQGQYLFYAAADKAHGIDELSPEKINANTLQVSFTVDVNYEEGIRRVAQSDIDDVKSRLAQGEQYERFREDVEMDGPGSFLDAFDSNIVLLPIESGENWASWIYGAKHRQNMPASLSVWYQAVEGERTLSINAYSISNDYTLEEIVEHWQSLVDKYRDMPMRVFAGAPVD